MGSIRCPECKETAIFNTKTRGTVTTFILKCNTCNRLVIKSGKLGDTNRIRKIAVETWNDIFSNVDEDD